MLNNFQNGNTSFSLAVLAMHLGLPFTNGNVFYVDPMRGDDGGQNDGSAPAKALRTIQEAVDRCSGITHDYVFLLPSEGVYDDDPVAAASVNLGIKVQRLVNAAIYINKPYVHIVGLQEKWGYNVVVKPSAAATAGTLVFGANADYCSVHNVSFVNTANAIMVLASGTNYCIIDGCFFVGGTIGIDADAGDCLRTVIRNCYFEDQSTYGVALHSSEGFVEDCVFVTPGATTPTAFLYITGANPSSICRLHMNGNASASAGISVNNVAAVVPYLCTICNCTDNISKGTGAEADIIMCFSENGGQGAAAFDNSLITA